ncbi:alpha/beta fold hydrolase [Citricoccus sp. GCM10030269]|uniref:alpha/beta fold hydrolase n=1 Tax=Citricoccus sp. GCM10030269 TaxID=3273388 RepID=UPI003611BBBB
MPANSPDDSPADSPDHAPDHVPDHTPGSLAWARRLQLGEHTVNVRGTVPAGRQPILLVHGIGMSGEYFFPFAEVLAPEYDVYAVDLPGYGTTPKPERVLTLPELGDVLAEVIETLGLKAPVVVGHSMGCQVVAQALSGHPEMAAGYVLIGPTVDPDASSLLALAWRLARDTFIEPVSTNIVVARNYLRMGPVRYLRTARSMVADRLDASIVRCDLPGLIVRGERDPIASRAWIQQLARLAPDAGPAEIPGGPHAVQHNRPRQLAAACAPFLASVTRSAQP